MIYLASPYSHPDSGVREARYVEACRFVAELMRAGRHVYSPIAYSHPVAMIGKFSGGWEFWKKFDLEMLGSCQEMMVLRLEGWQDSIGVREEIEVASRWGMPITYVGGE